MTEEIFDFFEFWQKALSGEFFSFLLKLQCLFLSIPVLLPAAEYPVSFQEILLIQLRVSRLTTILSQRVK